MHRDAILTTAKQIEEWLTPAIKGKLDQILTLTASDGSVNLEKALRALYPTLYRKSPPKAQSALRKFRQAIKEASADAGVKFLLKSDGRTRTPLDLRTLHFRIDDRAHSHLDARARSAIQPLPGTAVPIQLVLSRSTDAEIAGNPEGMVAPEGIPLNEHRPLIRYFLVCAQGDKRRKDQLLKRLESRLQAHPRARIELCYDIEVKAHDAQRQSPREEMQSCDFGLLLIGPRFFATRFVTEEKLPELCRNKPVIPVCIEPVATDGAMDLQGLDPAEFLYSSSGRAFSQQRHADDLDRFAEEVFRKIDERLVQPAATARLRRAALAAALERLEMKALVSNPGTPLGEIDKKAIHLTSVQGNPHYREDALEFLLRWIRDEKASPWCALLGEYGMGKTTTCKALARDLISRRDNGEKLPLPIYLDLRPVGKAARGGLVLDEILSIILAQSWKAGPSEARPTAAEIVHLVGTQGAVVVWDGLDEVLVHLDTHAGQQFTRQLYSILPPRAASTPGVLSSSPSRLLISCRTHFFRTLREQQTHFLAEGRDNIRAENYSAFLLLPFDEAQIRQYLAQTLPGQNPDRAMETIAAVHNLRELAERPYTLSLIASELAGIERWKAEGRRVTGVTLYRHMVLSWLERDTGKHHFTPDHKQALMEYVAAELWRSGARYWSVVEMEQWLIDFLKARPDLAAHYPAKDPELLKEDLRTATFLVRDDEAEGGKDQFRFAHTSLQEYFLAGYLRRCLAEGKPELWALPAPSAETVDFLGQLLLEEEGTKSAEMATLSRLRDEYRPGASELAFAYFLLAKRKGYPAPSSAGFQLPGANLAGWEIKGTAGAPLLLARANFRGARIRNTQWKHCNLEDADFGAANADRAEFLYCRLAGTTWGEASIEAALFRDCRCNGTEFDEARRNRTRFIRCVGRSPRTAPDAPARLFMSTAPVNGARLQPASGHTNVVMGCAWSPDGTKIVSASYDNTLRLWDAATGDCLNTLAGHTNGVSGCAWSPDGTKIVSASYDNTLRMWDAATGDCLNTLAGHTNGVSGCAWSPDGTKIVSASDDKTLRLWHAATGDCLNTLAGHTNFVSGCAWSPDGTKIVSASDDKTLRLWHAATGDCLNTLAGHTNFVSGCAWSPDGTKIVSASYDNTLRLWDAATGDCLNTLAGHRDSVRGCAWSPDGTKIVSASYDNTLRLWDAATGDCLNTLAGHTSLVMGCAWSPDGTKIVSASYDNPLRLWDAATGDCLNTLAGHTQVVSGCAWSPDGTKIVSASYAKTLRLWDAATGDCLNTLAGHTNGVSGCAWSPDGTKIVSASDDKTLRLWHAATGDCLNTLAGHTNVVRGCAWSPDGTKIVSASDDKTLRLWDAATGDCLNTLAGHTDWVMGCAWSPDGTKIVSASDDNTLRLWDAATGDCLNTLAGHTNVVRGCAWSPDGTKIVSASYDQTLRLWDAATGDCLNTLAGHTNVVRGCAWSPDGTKIVSASDDNTLRLWDAATGDCLNTLAGHTSLVRGCAWSPDGTKIVSASDDGSLRLWDAATGRQLALACYHFLHPRSESGSDWAALDIANNRILACSPEAWRSLGWVTPGTPANPSEWLPAETFGPLPVHADARFLVTAFPI